MLNVVCVQKFAGQVAGKTNVQCTVTFTGQDINIIKFLICYHVVI